jgi:hypothetical protein
MDSKLIQEQFEERLSAIEKRLGVAETATFGRSFRLVPAYVVGVNDDASRITVSPWDSSNEFEATYLSTIPTNIADGRRLQGVPTPRTETTPGDNVLCAVVDNRWYILGFFNLPDQLSSERVSYVKKYETIKPLRGGILLKISKIGQIVVRKSNWLKVWLGSWANVDLKGLDPLDDTREPTFTAKFANFVQRAWGGIVKWTRAKTDERDVDWKTTHVDVKTRSYEPETITDYDLPQKTKNEGLEDTGDPAGTSSLPPANPFDLNYVDKVIKKSGHIEGDTHVYEREVRQSKEENKEKTVFTRLREGHREGVLREYETEDVLALTKTNERRGIFGDGRLMHNLYVQYSDSNGTVKESLEEEFGNDGVDLYRLVITNSAGKQIKIVATESGFELELEDDSAELILNSKNIKVGRGADTNLVRYEELEAVLLKLWDLIKNHDHNTGVGPSTPASGGVYLTAQLPVLDSPSGLQADIEAIKSETSLVK